MFSNRNPFNQPQPAVTPDGSFSQPLEPPPASIANATRIDYGVNPFNQPTEPPPLPQDDPGAQPPPISMVPDGYREVTPPLEAALASPPVSAEQAEWQWQRDQLSKIIERLDLATESKADLAESLQRHRNAIMQLVNGGIAHLDFLGAGLANLSNEDAQIFAYELGNLRKAVAALHLLIPLSLPSEQQDAAE